MNVKLPIVAMEIAPTVDAEETLRTFGSQVRAVAATFPATLLLVAPEQHLSATPGLAYGDDHHAMESAVTFPAR